MSMSACSRRLSGSVRRPRVPSVTTSGGHSFELRPIATFPSVETVLQDTIGVRPSVQDAASEDIPNLNTIPTPSGWRRVAAYATLGRGRPARLDLHEDINAECIADTTFQRQQPERGLLWRPCLPVSSRSSTPTSAHVTAPLNLSFDFNSAQGLSAASLQHSWQAHSEGPKSDPGLSLVRLIGSSQVELPDLVVQAQAQAHARVHATRAVSLNDLSPLSTPLSSSADALQLCAPQRIKLEASGVASIDTSASASDPCMSSATSVRYAALPTSGASKSAISLPSLAIPPASESLLAPSPGVSNPSLLHPLMPFPSPSVFQSSLYSPGLAPPSPQPSTFIPESPIAHARRAPSPGRTPPMLLYSTPLQHTLEVRLPAGLSSEMVTISVKKGARLAVVADLWHREHDSHYEWEVIFAQSDVDMASIRAVFDVNGQLVIHVRRRSGIDGLPPPLICSR